MGKSKRQGIGTLVVGGLVFYAAFWLYQRAGWIGVIAVLCAFAAACVGKMMLSRRRREASFDKLIRYLLVKRMSGEQIAQLNAAMSRKSPKQAELVNKSRQLHDAMETSLSSKQRSAAEAAMQSVHELHRDIQQEYTALVSARLMIEIDDVIDKHDQAFNTRLYTNVAEGLLEKADRVEEAQTSMEYVTAAVQTLDDGLENPKSDKPSLQAVRRKAENGCNAVRWRGSQHSSSTGNRWFIFPSCGRNPGWPQIPSPSPMMSEGLFRRVAVETV